MTTSSDFGQMSYESCAMESSGTESMDSSTTSKHERCFQLLLKHILSLFLYLLNASLLLSFPLHLVLHIQMSDYIPIFDLNVLATEDDEDNVLAAQVDDENDMFDVDRLQDANDNGMFDLDEPQDDDLLLPRPNVL
jgi:hypothetical protein